MTKHKFIIEVDVDISNTVIKRWENDQMNYYMCNHSKEDAKEIVKQNGFFKAWEYSLKEAIEDLLFGEFKHININIK